jgi:hypothetical protein
MKVLAILAACVATGLGFQPVSAHSGSILLAQATGTGSGAGAGTGTGAAGAGAGAMNPNAQGQIPRAGVAPGTGPAGARAPAGPLPGTGAGATVTPPAPGTGGTGSGARVGGPELGTGATGAGAGAIAPGVGPFGGTIPSGSTLPGVGTSGAGVATGAGRGASQPPFGAPNAGGTFNPGTLGGLNGAGLEHPADRFLSQRIRAVLGNPTVNRAGTRGAFATPGLDLRNVQVVSQNGVVTLVGLADPMTRRLIDFRVRRIPGVQGVNNLIQVPPTAMGGATVPGTTGRAFGNSGVPPAPVSSGANPVQPNVPR